MRTFLEYLEFEELKNLVMSILDPEGEISDNKSVLSRPLAEFKFKDNLLTDPKFSDIINKSENRESIVQAIDNNTTTVGNLLSLL